MASYLPLLVLLLSGLCLGLGGVSARGLPSSRRESRVISGGPAPPQRGLARVTSEPSAEAGTHPLKRDISLNQDLRSLANMLLTQEYNRILSDRRNREFLRQIGKRAGGGAGARAREDFGDVIDGDDDDDVIDMPLEALDESWSRW